MFPSYAELHCLTNFTFLRGASHPEELVKRAARLGYSALAVTDECSLAGVVRAHVAAKEHGIKLIAGSELALDGEARGVRRKAQVSPSPQPSPARGEGGTSSSPFQGEGWGGGEVCSSLLPPPASLAPAHSACASRSAALRLVLLATDRTGYGNLSELITRARRRSKKGEYHLTAADLDDGVPGCLALLLPGEEPDIGHARWLGSRFEGRCWIAAELLLGPDDRTRLEHLECHAQDAGLPLVAAGGVHMHVRARRALQDTLTAVRFGTPLARCGHALFPNGERYLRSRERLARLYPPELLIATLDVAERCSFSLDSLRYEYPEEIVPAGETPASWLRRLTEQGFRWRFGAQLREEGGGRWEASPSSASLGEVGGGRWEVSPSPQPSRLTPRASPGAADASRLTPHASPPTAHSAAGWGSHFTAGRSVDIAKARALVEHELELIAELQYEPYFLTVYDVVKFARSQGILCQGRGSAANSAVCYCLGVTEVDPARMDMLFERFISRERNEPPDIDVDFEHERREEVIQYIYRKYGRDRAALAATVITYRPKSALRDVGKALGLDLAQVDRLAKSLAWWDGRKVRPERLHEMGFDPGSPVIRKLIALVNIIVGFPRHLSQHVGGFVISRGPLSRLVPIENAAMDDRTVIQWDKDDLDALGLLKIDVLALGMLTAIRRALALVSSWRGKPFGMADVPPEDPGVYEMIGHADTIGVFQIESRAQQAMLPRMQPSCFYDLVIEVAIVRPGPIQGGMVHPYLRRRQGLEPVTYPSADIKKVLERTLGVPIFQEQVMQLAVVAAGFTPGEADKLRRAMAAWRRKGGLEPFEKRLKDGMRERGYPEQFAEQIYRQILGFGEYGFPESHSASFALLVYVSCWLKRYEQAAFTCALLNSQPMGFYAPSQLVQDAQRHDVQVLPPDVLVSEWDCTLEPQCGSSREEGGVRGEEQSSPALRLGLRMVKGLSQAAAERLVEARQRPRLSPSPPLSPTRGEGGFALYPVQGASWGGDGACSSLLTPHSSRLTIEDLAHAAGLNRHDMNALAAAGALASISGHRRQAMWDVTGIEPRPPVLRDAPIPDPAAQLGPPTEGQDIVADYASLGLTLGRHPVALLRPRLAKLRMVTAAQLRQLPHGKLARAAGIVIGRQRPDTASGVIFVTLEDETGMVNVVVWRDVAERQRRALLGSQLLAVHGTVERQKEVVHLLAGKLVDHSALLGGLVARSRDFH
jgi:error-prone DNA polymerase